MHILHDNKDKKYIIIKTYYNYCTPVNATYFTWFITRYVAQFLLFTAAVFSSKNMPNTVGSMSLL